MSFNEVRRGGGGKEINYRFLTSYHSHLMVILLLLPPPECVDSSHPQHHSSPNLLEVGVLEPVPIHQAVAPPLHLLVREPQPVGHADRALHLLVLQVCGS